MDAMNKNLDITNFKLLPSAKPSLFHGSTVRKAVSLTLWNKLRKFTLESHNQTCDICCYTPNTEQEIKRLHVHEVEEFDFDNKVCNLINLELLCIKCHSFKHILRTKAVVTKEQWDDLMTHFAHVNQCDQEIVRDFNFVILESFKLKGFIKSNPLSFGKIEEVRELLAKPTRFTIAPTIPLNGELTMQLKKKGLLYTS